MRADETLTRGDDAAGDVDDLRDRCSLSPVAALVAALLAKTKAAVAGMMPKKVARTYAPERDRRSGRRRS